MTRYSIGATESTFLVLAEYVSSVQPAEQRYRGQYLIEMQSIH